MRVNKTAFRTLVVAAFCGLCGVIGYQASGNRAAMAPPTAVAVVNLPAVLEGLQQRGEAEMRLAEMEAVVRAEQERRQTEAKALQEELEALGPGAARDAKQNELEEALVGFQAWVAFTADEVDIEKALAFHDLYRSIKQAAAELAKADGYDLVIVDDSLGELAVNPNSKVPRELQIQQQMSTRRLLYASEMVDITDDLITRMNNAF